MFPKCHSPCDWEKYKDAVGKSLSILKGMVVSKKFLVGCVPAKVAILLLVEPDTK